MTGEKNRFKTTEKLWDLDDKQLKSPVHDAMVLWLMDEDNLKALLFDHCDKESYDVYSDKEYDLNECLNVYLNCISERPIMSSNTFIAGYADLVVTFRFEKYISKEVCPIDPKWYPRIRDIEYFEDMELLLKEYLNDESFNAKMFLADSEGEYKKKYFKYNDEGELVWVYYPSEILKEEWDIVKHAYPTERNYATNKEYIPRSYLISDFWMNVIEGDFYGSYCDWLKYGNKYTKEDYGCTCLIEVKPYIDSFGAVLRQINSYKKFYRDDIMLNRKRYFTKYCLFTFDKRFDKQFESQGITVLHPWTSKEDMLEMYGLR